MSTLRKTAVAGTFYPADPQELRETIEAFYDKADDQPAIGKVLIAPHAGYIYSGSIAASCYAPLRKRADEISRVVLLGPSHYVGFHGMAVPECEFYETPLGNIKIDKNAKETALNCEEVFSFDQAHLQEHSLEVHLPFLKESLNDFTLLPIVVGACKPEIVADLIKCLWGGPETLIVISTDLSHFKDYKDASECDLKTCSKIEKLDINFDHNEACGSTPVKGLILAAKEKNILPKLIDLRNSGDTSGNKSRVVGYASFICDEEKSLATVLSKSQKVTLLQLARHAIASKLGVESAKPETSDLPDDKVATFVTLKLSEELRGCIGTLSAHRSLLEDVEGNAISAAFKDPRFGPLSAKELIETKISISLLTEPEDIQFDSEEDLLDKIRPGVDGLILSDDYKRGTFLPSVWEDLPDKELFWKHLKRKAGLPIDYWSSTLTVQRYTSVYLSE